MSTRTKRPLGRRIQQRVFRVLNVPMRTVLGLPFATPLSGRLMLVFLTGRKTGKSYRQPVSYIREGTVLLTPGGATGSSTCRRAGRSASGCAAGTCSPGRRSWPMPVRSNGCSRS
jgi:hypothetical protein